VLSGEATTTNFIVFGLIRPGLESTIYRTRGEHANHYVTDAVTTYVIVKVLQYNITNNIKNQFSSDYNWLYLFTLMRIQIENKQQTSRAKLFFWSLFQRVEKERVLQKK
jgi:hypothetical protein